MDRLFIGIEAFDFLKKECFSVLQSILVQDKHEAARAAVTIGFPVALKISSANALHKTEVGGVRVSLASEAAVIDGFGEIMSNFQSKNPGASPDGIIVQKQGDGFELIVGTINDPQFGPAVMFGLGGIFAEAVQDISFRLIPIQMEDAMAMMEELGGYEAIRRPRKGSIDLAGIRDFLVNISNCVVNHPEIQEMDLNPVFVSSRGIEICDARIRIDEVT